MTSPDRSASDRRRALREPITVIEPIAARSDEPVVMVSLSAIADLQDSLLVAMNDLKRLEGLLDHATGNLLDRFNAAMQAMDGMPKTTACSPVREALHTAVTELQFHDMSTQLLVHTGKVLQRCAYTLAEQAMEPDEEESGVVVSLMPDRPNPVTQSEMDAGSIDLF